MCDILVDEMGRAPPHRHRASVSHLLQLLSQQGSPGGGKQKVRLFRVNVKTKPHTEFHEHLLSAVHKDNGEPDIFLLLLMVLFKISPCRKKKPKNYECS